MTPLNLYNVDRWFSVFLQELLYDRRMYEKGKKESHRSESCVHSGRTADEEQDRTNEAYSEASANNEELKLRLKKIA